MLHYELITDHNALARFKDDWRRLSDACPNEVSTAYEWCQALMATHLQDNDKFTLVVLRDGAATLGLVPLVLRKHSELGFPLCVLTPLDEMYNTHSDLLIHIADGNHAVVATLVDAILNIGYTWDVFHMERLLEENPLIAQLESCFQEAALRCDIRKNEPSFFVTLRGSYGDYLKNRSGKFRSHLNRMVKKLANNGTVEFRSNRDFADVSEAYCRLLQVELKSWKHLHGTSISAVSRQEQFYRLLCESTAERGYLHLLFLYCVGVPVAYNLGLVNNNTYLYLKTSFDEEYRRFGPSTILRAHLVEGLIDAGIECLDFPGEPYEWERQWADELRWHKSLLVLNNTATAKLFAVCRYVKHKVSRTDKEETVTYHDPKNVKSASD